MNRLHPEGHGCFIIAEAGVNHNGDLKLARQLIDVAAEAGADAVKFQTFTAERVATQTAPKAAYQVDTTGERESQFEMIRRLELTEAQHLALIAHCRERDVLFLSTPFDEESADMLDRLGVPMFKVPSGELTNLPFVAHVARKKKPMIVSTGMATLSEVEVAVETIRQNGDPMLTLLQCVSSYPADPSDVNLRAMHTMSAAFGVPVGYSDHTTGIAIALAAVAMGACVLEKHFTLDRSLPGPDHRASLEPGELATLVRGVRAVESALGDGVKRPVSSEMETAAVARKSVVAAMDLSAGATLTEEVLSVRRPGTGLPPAFLPYLSGRTLRKDVSRGDLITLDVIL